MEVPVYADDSYCSAPLDDTLEQSTGRIVGVDGVYIGKDWWPHRSRSLGERERDLSYLSSRVAIRRRMCSLDVFEPPGGLRWVFETETVDPDGVQQLTAVALSVDTQLGQLNYHCTDCGGVRVGFHSRSAVDAPRCCDCYVAAYPGGMRAW